MKVHFSLACLVTPLFAFTPIPERISVGTYSTSLECDDQWTVRVYEDKGVVYYECANTLQGARALQLTVYRVSVPQDAVGLDEKEVATRLVRNDGLKFHKTVFGRRVQLPPSAKPLSVAAGTAYVFGHDRPVFASNDASHPLATRLSHYGKAALLLPPHWKTTRVAFLVVSHQAGESRHARLEQDEYFEALLRGLRETQTPSSTPASH